MLTVAIVGILAALALYGVARYLKHSKVAEPDANLAAIENGARATFRSETPFGAPGSELLAHEFCPSAAMVPSMVPIAQHIAVATSDCTAAGWSCVTFTVDAPQNYAYSCASNGGTATSASYTADAHGDLDGNGTQSTCELTGAGGLSVMLCGWPTESSTRTNDDARAMRARGRGFVALQAVSIAIVGLTVAGVIVVGCVRAVRLSRTAEAVDNLDRLVEGAARARTAQPKIALSSTPMTPASVPRGEPVVDAPGAWDHPSFKAAGFAIEGPHWYSYRLDVDPDPRTPLRALAFGDLDGDGAVSTFERHAERRGPAVVAVPGLWVSADLE